MMRDDTDTPVIVHLEFQSSAPRNMVLRMLEYVVSVYVDLVRQDSSLLTTGLPVVVPIVLYNGKAPWSAPTNLSDLVHHSGEDDPMWPYILKFRYLAIDEIREAKAHKGEDRGLLGVLFALEAVEDEEDLRTAITDLLSLARGQQQVLESFVTWMKRVMYNRSTLRLTQHELAVLLNEEDPMLNETLDRLFEEKHNEGLEQGLEQGLKRGRTSTLLRQLERKFGPDETREARLMSLSHEQVDALSLALLDASDEDALFALVTETD